MSINMLGPGLEELFVKIIGITPSTIVEDSTGIKERRQVRRRQM